MSCNKYLRDRSLSVTKSESEEQEQIRLVESPEPEEFLEEEEEESDHHHHVMMDDHYVDGGSHFYNVTTMASSQKPAKRIIIDRPVIIQTNIYPKYSNNVPYIPGPGGSKNNNNNNKSERLGGKCINCSPTKIIFSLVPILSWLPKYQWNKVSFDLIAGFMVAVMNIPQGMAYAMLGNLKPIVGIYMAFFPVIIYSIFGTSRHVSMGTFAVICLMSGKAASDYQAAHPSSTMKSEDYILLITTALSFAVGIWQFLMGVFRLGALSLLLNSELVSGFTTGAAVHVLTSQVRNLLGLTIAKRSGIFKIIWSYIDMAKNIQSSNVAAVIISVITIGILTFYNELVKPQWAKRIRFPLPIELVTIIAATLMSLYLKFHEVYNVAVVGTIPTGFPAPEVPPFDIVAGVFFPDGLIICVVAYAISISMAKIFAGKHNYVVDANQELIAQGASNFCGSFFSCAPISVSLSRSLIQEQVGGHTQLASLFSCFLLVFVLLWVGPCFETLPNCVLSSIIVVALKGMFLQVSDLFTAWKLSKLNGFIWLSTFLATVLLDIEYGLVIGIVLSIITLIWRSNHPKVSVLGSFADTDLYADINSSNQVKEISKIKIIKYTGSLNFATAESFISRIFQLVNPDSLGNKGKKRKESLSSKGISTISKEKINENMSIDEAFSVNNEHFQVQLAENIEWIILDMSSVSSLDPAGAKALNAVQSRYEAVRIRVLLTGCPKSLLDTMKTCNVLAQIGNHNIFASIHDAVVNCDVDSRRHSMDHQKSTEIVIPTHMTDFEIPRDHESDNENAYQVLESSIKHHRRQSVSSGHRVNP